MLIYTLIVHSKWRVYHQPQLLNSAQHGRSYYQMQLIVFLVMISEFFCVLFHPLIVFDLMSSEIKSKKVIETNLTASDFSFVLMKV
jgi:hypothetical protein